MNYLDLREAAPAVSPAPAGDPVPAERLLTEPRATLRVGLLADCELARQGLQAMIEAMSEIEIVPGADPAALRRHGGVDVLILSSTRPEGAAGGLAEIPGAKVLLLLEDSGEAALEAAAASGCHGFLIRRETCPWLLGDTLRRMMRGEIPMPAVMTARLLTQASSAGRQARVLPLRLTAREHQVLGYMADGLSNKQIARRLQISTHGVKRLVTNVLAKLDCGNRTLAVAVALRDGLIGQRAGAATASPAASRLN